MQNVVIWKESCSQGSFFKCRSVGVKLDSRWTKREPQTVYGLISLD